MMAPIVGPVMWLGGLLAKENKNLKSDKILLEEELFTEESSTMDVDGNEKAIPVNRSTKSHSSKVDHSNKESHAMKRNDNNSRDLVVTQTVSEYSEEGNHMAYQSRKTRRKMSWADESGQSLDEYYVESSKKVNPADGSLEIANKSVPRKPIKSAIRNSRTHETTTSQNHQPSSCIPYMPSTSSNVKGCAPTNNKNGYISPQWGWYITTTPPTPEYIQRSNSASGNQLKVLSHQMNTNYPHAGHHHVNIMSNGPTKHNWNPSTAPIREVPKPVFKKATPNYSSGWPTVPI